MTEIRVPFLTLRRNCRMAHRFDGYTARMCYPAIGKALQ